MASKLEKLLGEKPAEKVTESVAKDPIARWSESHLPNLSRPIYDFAQSLLGLG
jgi:hypothetical protein